MEIQFSHVLGTAWISASSKKFQKHLTLKCLCFLIVFHYYGNSLFPYFGNCMDFCFTQSIWETHYFGMSVFSDTFPVLWEFTLSIWISASSKIFKKPINLKCLCFPILFPYYANPLFPFVGNCMDFCFKWKIPETLNLEVFVFSQIFSLLWEFTFLIFWELYVLMPRTKYVRNP